ncbi:MAG: hypothetical protein RIS47_723, partial [Bacteroidota bacterium]
PETRTQLEESKISQQGLLGHYKAKIDIENYVDAMIRAKNSGIVISKETFNLQYVTDGDMLQLVESMIKLQQADLQVKEADLLRMKIVGGNMEKMADALIRIKISQLENVSVEELIQFHLIGGAVDDYVVALELVRNNHLDLVKQDIINHQLNGGDIVNFISAYAMNKNFRMGITRDELEIASVNGADVSEVLTIIRSTKDKPYEIDFQFAVELSNADVTPTEAIAWATVPKVVLVEPSPSIVTRNGIEILPKVTVTLRGKIENYFSHSREEVVFDRVREALITEMETFGTHEDILHNLEWISKRLLHQLQGRQEMSHTLYKPENEIRRDIDENDKKEQRLNEESAFELLDVSIADILIGKDIFEQLRMREAEYYKELSKKDSEKRISLARADEEEAKARLIKSRAQLHEGMAKGFESGKDLSKEYLKGEIFGYGDEIKKKEK